MDGDDERAMEQRHLETFRDVRERLLAQRDYWRRPGHPAQDARTMTDRLDEELALNASLIAIAEEGVAAAAEAPVGASGPTGE